MPATIFGYHSIEETMKRSPGKGTLFLSRANKRIAALRAAAEAAAIPVSEVEEGELTRLCGSPAHRGAALVTEKEAPAPTTDLRTWLSSFTAESALALVLDHISDPQNLGAILRSADQFEADLVVLPSRRSAQETETVAKVSSGASAYVPLMIVPNIPTALALMKENGFWIYGADVEGQPAGGFDFRGRTCLVMGSEGEGMRRLVKERCDLLVRIPAGGHVDSFNVSVAAGILMYEIRRQQGFPGLH
jgi:23S rRNA (guanosine2251-2'-O)-methyltransferase